MSTSSVKIVPNYSCSPTTIIDGVELMIIIIATFGQALSGQAYAIHIIGVLVVWRFLVSGISLGFRSRTRAERPVRWVLESVVTTRSQLSSPPSLLPLGFVVA